VRDIKIRVIFSEMWRYVVWYKSGRIWCHITV
jgi:hypothetical protein